MLESVLLLLVGIKLGMPWIFYVFFIIGFLLKLLISTGKVGVVCLLLKDQIE